MLKKLVTTVALIMSLATYAPTVSAQSDQLVHFIFAMEAKHGHLIQVRGNQYRLTIPRQDVHSILAFSERPKRIAVNLVPEDFWSSVSKGPNPFDKNPPNIVITWQSKHVAQAYEMSHYRVGKKTITMDLKLLGRQNRITEAVTGPISIYIDDETVDLGWARCPVARN